jgi:hypothetical protein
MGIGHGKYQWGRRKILAEISNDSISPIGNQEARKIPALSVARTVLVNKFAV